MKTQGGANMFFDGFRRGWNNAKVFYSITGKYKKEESRELKRELINNGLMEQDWKKFAFGRDRSLSGMGYSFAGFIFFLTHGEISRV